MGTRPDKFGDLVTADYVISDRKGKGGETVAIVIKDVWSGWSECTPLKARTEGNTFAAMRDFVGIREKVRMFHSDDARELKAAARRLGWRHRTATPYRPQSNGIAERSNRTVLEGTRCALYHAGMPETWWTFAARHFCMMLNILVRNKASPYFRRFNEPFRGRRIPFGALVDYRPPTGGPGSAQKTKWGPKSIPGIFLGYHFNPGGRWSQDYLVACLDDFDTSDDNTYRKVNVHRIREIVFTESDVQFPLRKVYDEIHRSLSPIEVPARPLELRLPGDPESVPQPAFPQEPDTDDELEAAIDAARETASVRGEAAEEEESGLEDDGGARPIVEPDAEPIPWVDGTPMIRRTARKGGFSSPPTVRSSTGDSSEVAVTVPGRCTSCLNTGCSSTEYERLVSPFRPNGVACGNPSLKPKLRELMLQLHTRFSRLMPTSQVDMTTKT